MRDRWPVSWRQVKGAIGLKQNAEEFSAGMAGLKLLLVCFPGYHLLWKQDAWLDGPLPGLIQCGYSNVPHGCYYSDFVSSLLLADDALHWKRFSQTKETTGPEVVTVKAIFSAGIPNILPAGWEERWYEIAIDGSDQRKVSQSFHTHQLLKNSDNRKKKLVLFKNSRFLS